MKRGRKRRGKNINKQAQTYIRKVKLNTKIEFQRKEIELEKKEGDTTKERTNEMINNIVLESNQPTALARLLTRSLHIN